MAAWDSRALAWGSARMVREGQWSRPWSLRRSPTEAHCASYVRPNARV